MVEDIIFQIILGSIGATISGIVLLLVHHSKVKQELELQRKKELFARKQKTHRLVLDQVFKILDFSHLLGSDVNWRITRYLYNELLLIGSNSVINSLNDFMKNYSEVSNEEGNKMIKKIWSDIREDLYEESLSFEQIKFIGPRRKSVDVINSYANYQNKLQPLGLDSLESLANMDVNIIHTKTDIGVDELSKIKEMAEFEKKLLEMYEESRKK